MFTTTIYHQSSILASRKHNTTSTNLSNALSSHNVGMEKHHHQPDSSQRYSYQPRGGLEAKVWKEVTSSEGRLALMKNMKTFPYDNNNIKLNLTLEDQMNTIMLIM